MEENESLEIAFELGLAELGYSLEVRSLQASVEKLAHEQRTYFAP